MQYYFLSARNLGAIPFHLVALEHGECLGQPSNPGTPSNARNWNLASSRAAADADALLRFPTCWLSCLLSHFAVPIPRLISLLPLIKLTLLYLTNRSGPYTEYYTPAYTHLVTWSSLSCSGGTTSNTSPTSARNTFKNCLCFETDQLGTSKNYPVREDVLLTVQFDDYNGVFLLLNSMWVFWSEGTVNIIFICNLCWPKYSHTGERNTH